MAQKNPTSASDNALKLGNMKVTAGKPANEAALSRLAVGPSKKVKGKFEIHGLYDGHLIFDTREEAKKALAGLSVEDFTVDRWNRVVRVVKKAAAAGPSLAEVVNEVRDLLTAQGLSKSDALKEAKKLVADLAKAGVAAEDILGEIAKGAQPAEPPDAEPAK